NGIAYRVLCQRPGDIIILDETAHPLLKGAGLIPGLVQAESYIVKGKRGIFTAKQIEPLITSPKGHNIPSPRIVSVEQSTNFGGGAIWPLSTLKEVCSLAHRYSIYTHMDGARLLNAVVETNISAAQYAQDFDSVWIDFSKSLGAPMGAVLAGSQAFIEDAWYYKFQQGGGLHQAGIIAAGCLYGLKHNFSRIPDIHAKTKQLALFLSQLPFIVLNPLEVETNVIICEVRHPTYSAISLASGLLEKGIRVLALDESRIRIMTHLDISLSDIEEICKAFEELGSTIYSKRGAL
ncbi:MAG: low specificity L-threonine aldolase, partial [Alphaproteobacteria bacterium]|nr:low specificity L-threonine aldolase [Alphaproteobacteria bacterium]